MLLFVYIRILINQHLINLSFCNTEYIFEFSPRTHKFNPLFYMETPDFKLDFQIIYEQTQIIIILGISNSQDT